MRQGASSLNSEHLTQSRILSPTIFMKRTTPGEFFAAAVLCGGMLTLAVWLARYTGPSNGQPPAVSIQPAPLPGPVKIAPLVGRPAASSLVHAILTPPPPVTHRGLISRIDALPDTLSEAESMAICLALREGVPGHASLPPRQRHHTANQLMDALLRQQAAGPWLAAELAAMWHSNRADKTVRDYALQHLGQLLEGRGPVSIHLTHWRAEGLPVLVAAARESSRRSAATALLALHYLHSELPAGTLPVNGTAIDALAEAAVRNPAADSAVRAAAFQAASPATRKSMLPAARAAIATAGTAPGEKLSAIHYLGAWGEADDAALLSRIEAAKDLRFRTAAQSARAKLSAR